ncbi:MAG: MFS transporter [Anaerolineales bacterium]|jgi:MFS family permease
MGHDSNEARRPVGYLALVRSNRNFRFLWTGQVVSLLGDWFNLIASAALVSHLTRSGLAVGSLFVIRMLAPFLVSPLAGVLADRYNRKTLLVVADILRGIVVLGFLLVRTAEQVWLLYVLTAVQLAFSGVFFPARNAIIPNIVSRSELGAANAISTTTWSVMLSLGAAIGGLVAGQWGNYPAFVVDSISFFLSAYFISHVQYTHDVEESSELAGARGQIAAAFRQYVDGLKYLKDHRDIFAITLHKSAVSLLASGAFQVIQVTLAQQVFVIGENGSTSLGLMYAFAGIGTGVGPILARVFTGDRDRPLRNAITISYFLGAIGLALTAPLASFTLVLAGTFIRMLGGGINWTFSTQLLLEWAPDKVRGRVFSSEFAMFTLANAISSATGGWLLDNTNLGISGIIWWMSGLMIIPGILWFAWTAFGKTSGQVKMENLPE